MSSPLTYIVVLTWNGWADTEECLRSLIPVLSDRMRVLVVDNGSTDGTPEKVRRDFPKFELVENGENLGFPAGNNVGIRYALLRGANHVILLNNDTVVDPSFAVELVTAAERDPKAGMVTSKLYFFDRPDVLWFAGGTFSTWTGRTTHSGFGQPDRGQFDHVSEIGRPCACSMLVSRSFVEDVGLMKEDLFLYGEEIDWMLRARRRGYKCVLAPKSKVWHRVSSRTGGPRTGTYLYYCVRNTLRIVNEHEPVGYPFLKDIRNIVIILTFTASVFTMKVETKNGLLNLWKGVLDYYRNISGCMKFRKARLSALE